MLNKFRFFKKCLVFFAVGVFATSAFDPVGSNGAKDVFAEAATADKKVLYYNNGGNTDGFYGEGVRSLFVMKDGTGEHTDYLKFGKSPSILQAAMDIPRENGSVLDRGKAELSFDICAQQTNHFLIMMIGDTKGKTQETFFMNGLGKMGYQMSGNWPSATYSPSCQRPYEKNRWYNIKIMIDLNARTLTYYLDGKLWGQTSVTNPSAFVDAEPQNIYFNIMTNYTMKSGAVAQSDGSEEFWLDNIKYSFPKQTQASVNASCGQDGNIYFSKNVEIDFTVTSPEDFDSEYNLDIDIRTSDNHSAVKKTEEISVKSGEARKSTIKVELPEFGFYNLNAVLRHPDGTEMAQCSTRFSVLNGIQDGERNEKMGVSNHFGHQYGDADIILPLESKMGFSVARDDVPWPHIVSNSGTLLDDNVYHRNFKTWSKKTMDAGRRILAIIGGAGHPGLLGYSWPASLEKLKTNNSLDEWYKHVESLVASQPGITDWEIYNEWNINSNNANGGSPEAYAEVLRTASRAIKKVNPNAKRIAFCTALVDTEWIERVLIALGDNPGQYFDGISVHPYVTSGEMPEKGGVEESMERLKVLMEKYGLTDKEVWSTEFGYSIGAVVNKVTEKSQAEYTVRGNFILDPYVDKNVMYTIVQKQTGSAGEDGFGIVRTWSGLDINYEARPLAAALANYNTLMAGAEFESKVKTDDGIYVYRYKTDDGKQLAAVWSTDADKTVGLNLGTDKVLQFDMYGNSTEVYAYNGEHTFYVTSSPMYLVGDINKFEISDAPKIKAENLNVYTAQNDNFKVTFLNSISNTQINADTSENISLEKRSCSDSAETLEFTTSGSHSEIKNYAFDGVSTAETVRLSCTDENGRVYFYAPITVDYKDAARTELEILPYKNGWWQAVLNITNTKSEKMISGDVSVAEPSSMAKVYKPKRFENIKSGESEKIVFNIPEQSKDSDSKFVFNVKIDDGEIVQVSDETSFVAIEKMKNAPMIDGVISDGEWNTKSPIVLDKLTQVQQIPNWGGINDLSGIMYTGYDDKYFYFAAKVTDDVHFERDDKDRLYTVDSVQIAFAPDREKSSKRTELGLALMNDESRLVRYSYAGGVSLMGIPDSALEYDLNKFVDTEYAIKNNGTETVYELKIPWGELFGPEFRINSERDVAFSALINDNDGNGRRGWIELSGGIGTVKDASQFVKIPLVK